MADNGEFCPACADPNNLSHSPCPSENYIRPTVEDCTKIEPWELEHAKKKGIEGLLGDFKRYRHFYQAWIKHMEAENKVLKQQLDKRNSLYE